MVNIEEDLVKRRQLYTLVISLALVLIIGLLAGCSGSTTTVTKTVTSGAGATATVTATVTATGAATTTPAPAGQVVWKMDFNLPVTDPETIMLQEAANDILKYTSGLLKIEVYPSSSLKLPSTKLGNLKAGLSEMFCAQTGDFEGEEDSFTVTDASQIWPSKEAEAKAVDALKPFKARIYNDVWGSHYITSKMMTTQLNGVFMATKPIQTLADFKGMKIRTTSARAKAGYTALGAAPVSMASGEVYQALKTGVLDGAVSGSRILMYQKWGEVVKYATETTMSDAVCQDIAVNNKAWNSIPKWQQDVVTAIFTGLGDRQRAMATLPGMSEYYRYAAEQMGVKYYEMSKADLEAFDKIFADLWYKDLPDFLKKPRVQEAWDLVKGFTVRPNG
jgi:TRAP-type C4-dicarboxylate transport system substrate-binding protein